MRVEVAPGVELFVRELGAGRPVVLLAGFGFDHEVWDRQFRVLAASHRAIGIDLRGTGRSDKPLGGYDLPSLAGDVAAVLDVLALEDVTLVGWSFGGHVAFRVAVAHAARIGRLVLVGSNAVRASACDAFPFGVPAHALEAYLVQGEQTARIAARSRAVAGGFREPPSPETLAWLMHIQLRMPSWAAFACFKTYAHLDQIADIPAVKVPVLQVTGAHDQAAPIAGARWLSERLADARLVKLPDCAHTPMIEAPQALENALLAFLPAEPPAAVGD